MRLKLLASSMNNSCLFRSTRRKAVQLPGTLVERVTLLLAPVPCCSRVPDFRLVLGVHIPDNVHMVIFFKPGKGVWCKDICEIMSNGHSTSRTKH